MSTEQLNNLPKVSKWQNGEPDFQGQVPNYSIMLLFSPQYIFVELRKIMKIICVSILVTEKKVWVIVTPVLMEA